MSNLSPALKKVHETLRRLWEEERYRYRERLPDVCTCTLEGNTVTVEYFSAPYHVTFPGCNISASGGGKGLSDYEGLLILHYLSRPFEEAAAASSASEAGWVSFKQLPNAGFYDTTYQRRGPEKIINSFAHRPEALRAAGLQFPPPSRGYTAEVGENFGDVSISLFPLPKIETRVVLYLGDEEFPPEAEILYRPDIINYLPLEDIAVLAGIIAGRLKKAAPAGGPV